MPVLDQNNAEQVKKYEDFIQTSEHGHMMQSMNWAKVKNNWNADYIYLEDDEGSITAALSIISVQNGDHAFMYAPRGPVCDIRDTDTVESLISEAKEIADKRNAFLLRMDPEVVYDESIVSTYRDLGYAFRSRDLNNEKSFSNPRHHMILDLPVEEDLDVMSLFKSKHRNKIRKTYKNGLETKKITLSDDTVDEAIDRFFDLTKEMSERQGISHRPKDYFVRLLNAFDHAVMFETQDDEEVLSSCIVVLYNKKAFYIYAASSNNKRNLNASAQMNYEGILYAVENGCREYDFGGVYGLDRSDGLYAFKHSFCGDEGLNEFVGELDVVYQEDAYKAFNEQ